MKKLLAATGILVLAMGLSGCGEEEQRKEAVELLEHRAELAEKCHDAGGRYILTIPPGQTGSSYYCIWDSEKKGGEWGGND